MGLKRVYLSALATACGEDDEKSAFISQTRFWEREGGFGRGSLAVATATQTPPPPATFRATR